MGELIYRRVVLKVSGEALRGHQDQSQNYDPAFLYRLCRELATVHREGVQLALVVGGGNLFRGEDARRLQITDIAQGHYMGMLATVINALALQAILEQEGVSVRVMSAIRIEQVCEPYIRRRAIHHLEKGYMVILASGTGNPFFTTDTAAVLRAIEIGADVVLKGTRVDGVYSADPELHPSATRYTQLTFEEAYRRNLKVMDMTAFTLCQENRLPLIVFNIFRAGDLSRVLAGDPSVGTRIVPEPESESDGGETGVRHAHPENPFLSSPNSTNAER